MGKLGSGQKGGGRTRWTPPSGSAPAMSLYSESTIKTKTVKSRGNHESVGPWWHSVRLQPIGKAFPISMEKA